jgi:branched-chain amino acid transport system ATP-binding protein
MLAIGRALMCRPSLLLLDEPSMGLAPIMVEKVSEIICDLRREGNTILLVEQNAFMALSISDEAYVIENGQTTMKGPAPDLLKDDYIKTAYLGI